MPTKTYRAGIGGIAIESSTFSPHRSTIDDFTVLRGQEMLPHYPFLPGWRFRDREDLTWLPCLHARAIPVRGRPLDVSGSVTAIKIGYLVPDLRVAARHALLALTPGAVDQDIASLTYRRASRPVFPLDPTMTWEPEIRVFGDL